jgi:hypothetical protein
MTALEVQPVLRALQKANIHIVALHNHMIGEAADLLFHAILGKGPTSDLAIGLKSTLDAQTKANARMGAHRTGAGVGSHKVWTTGWRTTAKPFLALNVINVRNAQTPRAASRKPPGAS